MLHTPQFQAKQPQANFKDTKANNSQFRVSQWYPDSGYTHYVTRKVDISCKSFLCLRENKVILENGQGFSITYIIFNYFSRFI